MGRKLNLRMSVCVRLIAAMRITPGTSIPAATSTTTTRGTRIASPRLSSINSDNVRHERKKLRRMVNKSRKGEIEPSKIDECYRCWKNNAENGNSYKLIRRTDKYLENLRKDGKDGNKENSTVSNGSCRRREP